MNNRTPLVIWKTSDKSLKGQRSVEKVVSLDKKRNQAAAASEATFEEIGLVSGSQQGVTFTMVSSGFAAPSASAGTPKADLCMAA